MAQYNLDQTFKDLEGTGTMKDADGKTDFIMWKAIYRSLMLNNPNEAKVGAAISLNEKILRFDVGTKIKDAPDKAQVDLTPDEATLIKKVVGAWPEYSPLVIAPICKTLDAKDSKLDTIVKPKQKEESNVEAK